MDASHFGCGQNHVVRLFLSEEGLHIGLTGQIQLGVGASYDIFKSGFLKAAYQTTAHQAAVACYVDFFVAVEGLDCLSFFYFCHDIPCFLLTLLRILENIFLCTYLFYHHTITVIQIIFYCSCLYLFCLFYIPDMGRFLTVAFPSISTRPPSPTSSPAPYHAQS